MGNDTPPALDENHLTRVTGGDPALMDEILGMLRGELDERVATLDNALNAGDREAAIQAAHKLQGAAAYTGAARLGAAAADLEARLREGADGGEALARLRTAVVQLRGLLNPGQASSSST